MHCNCSGIDAMGLLTYSNVKHFVFKLLIMSTFSGPVVFPDGVQDRSRTRHPREHQSGRRKSKNQHYDSIENYNRTGTLSSALSRNGEMADSRRSNCEDSKHNLHSMDGATQKQSPSNNTGCRSIMKTTRSSEDQTSRHLGGAPRDKCLGKRKRSDSTDCMTDEQTGSILIVMDSVWKGKGNENCKIARNCVTSTLMSRLCGKGTDGPSCIFQLRKVLAWLN